MDRGWNWLHAEGALARWQALCDADATLAHRLPGAEGRFLLRQPGLAVALDFTHGPVRLTEGGTPPPSSMPRPPPGSASCSPSRRGITKTCWGCGCACPISRPRATSWPGRSMCT